MNASTKTEPQLFDVSNHDASYWKQKYEETLSALQLEQLAHAKTRNNLLRILGDAIASNKK